MNSTQTFQIQKLPSSKLFYNKYVYKIEGRYDHAGRIVRQLRFNWVNPVNMKYDNFSLTIKNYLNRDDVKIRTEGFIFGIYTNDKAIVDELTTSLSKFIKNIYGPQSEEERLFLLSNSKRKIVRDVYPYKKYRYKIHFKHNMYHQWPDTNRKQVAQWLDPLYDNKRILLPKNTWLFVNGFRGFANSPCCYVENEQDLSMILMYLGDKIKGVDEFVLRSDIVNQV